MPSLNFCRGRYPGQRAKEVVIQHNHKNPPPHHKILYALLFGRITRIPQSFHMIWYMFASKGSLLYKLPLQRYSTFIVKIDLRNNTIFTIRCNLLRCTIRLLFASFSYCMQNVFYLMCIESCFICQSEKCNEAEENCHM